MRRYRSSSIKPHGIPHVRRQAIRLSLNLRVALGVSAVAGGQPGHSGRTRTLIPVDEVDEVVVLKPEQCSVCQAPLLGKDATPFRHQVMEIPPIQPVVSEYQWHELM